MSEPKARIRLPGVTRLVLIECFVIGCDQRARAYLPGTAHHPHEVLIVVNESAHIMVIPGDPARERSALTDQVAKRTR